MPETASAIPTYCGRVTLFHSWKKIRPTTIDVTMSNESMTPDVTVSPIFSVTNPKDMKTAGAIRIKARSQIENLSPFAQTVLMEFAETAIVTAITT
jgi:hypothetical protein